MKSEVSNKRFLGIAVFLVGIFAFFLLWFTCIHPMVVFDTDSWMYTYAHRKAVPIWKAWNPSKVFPEVFEPLLTMLSAYLIYPLTDDFLNAITVGYALFMALLLSFMFFMVYRKLRDAESSELCKILLLELFLLCHFWIFRTAETGNTYMLKCINVCTYFNYLMPAILNSAVVAWYSHNGGAEFRWNVLRKRSINGGIFLFLSYLCIYSNIWSGIIFATYVGAILLVDLVEKVIRKRFNIKTFLNDNITNIGILAIWAVSQLFEINGGRAAGMSGSIRTGLIDTLGGVKKQLTNMNHSFVISMLLILIFGSLVIVKNKNYGAMKDILLLFLSALFSTIYLILSCAMTQSGRDYISRTETYYGIFFLVMMMIMICGANLLRAVPELKLICPLAFFIIAVNCNTTRQTYLDSTINYYSPELCYRVGNDIIAQIKDADKNGKTEIVVYVPDFGTSDNWPLATYGYPRMTECLHKYGILSRYVTVTEMIPTYEKNVELHIAE